MKSNKNDSPTTTMPQAYLDMQMTAKIYLDLGPEEYKAIIAHDWPLESLDAETLATIKSGMQQILESRGLTCDAPFTGLDIRGFYTLAEMLDLEVEMQALTDFGDTQFVDAMHMVNPITGESIVLYNAVPSPKARRAAAKG
jgi:hypothetical protein